MKKETEKRPVIPAGSWSWTTVEDVIENHIYERYNVRASLDGDYRPGSDRIRDADLNVRKEANLYTTTGYVENAVTFRLDVHFDPLQGDGLELKELTVRLE